MSARKSDTALVRFNAEIKTVWIVKFSTCITSNIFVKLKMKTTKSGYINNSFLLDFDFGAIDQTSE